MSIPYAQPGESYDQESIDLNRGVTQDVFHATNQHVYLDGALLKHDEAEAKINADPNISEQYRKQQLADLKAKTAQALDSIEKQAQTGVRDAEARAQAVIQKHLPTNDAVVLENWKIGKDLLDATGEANPQSLQLLAGQSAEMRHALRKFLPVYIATKYAQHGPRAQQTFLQAAMQQLELAEAPHLSYGEREARRRLKEIAAGRERLSMAMQAARDHLTGKYAAALPGWKGNGDTLMRIDAHGKPLRDAVLK
jgi:hypothetical protein